MSRHLMPVMLGLLVLPAAAVIAAAYLAASSQGELAALSTVLIALGAGVFAIVMVVLMKLSRQEDWLYDQQDQVRDLHERHDALAARLGAVEEQAGRPSAKLDEIMGDMRALRDNFKSIVEASAVRSRPAEDDAPPREAPREQPLAWGASAPVPPPAAQPAPPKKGAEHLELLLEPVIELASGVTTHYRAMLDLTDENGHVVHHAELMRKADQGGMRAALDTHVVKLVGPVLRRLRLKNPGVRIFVPIGLSTLNAREEGSRIAQILERDVDVANGVVFEFDQKDLGALDDTGIGNVARLARLGATMSLTRAQVSGLISQHSASSASASSASPPTRPIRASACPRPGATSRNMPAPCSSRSSSPTSSRRSRRQPPARWAASATAPSSHRPARCAPMPALPPSTAPPTRRDTRGLYKSRLRAAKARNAETLRSLSRLVL